MHQRGCHGFIRSFQTGIARSNGASDHPRGHRYFGQCKRPIPGFIVRRSLRSRDGLLPRCYARRIGSGRYRACRKNQWIGDDRPLHASTITKSGHLKNRTRPLEVETDQHLWVDEARTKSLRGWAKKPASAVWWGAFNRRWSFARKLRHPGTR